MRVAVFVLPPIAFLLDPSLVHLAPAVTTRSGCCTATRPASSCAPPRAATPSGTCRSRSTAAYTLTARDRDEVYVAPAEADAQRGQASRKYRMLKLRARLSKSWFGDNVQMPTRGRARGGPAPRRARARADRPGRPPAHCRPATTWATTSSTATPPTATSTTAATRSPARSSASTEAARQPFTQQHGEGRLQGRVAPRPSRRTVTHAGSNRHSSRVEPSLMPGRTVTPAGRHERSAILLRSSRSHSSRARTARMSPSSRR